MKTPLIFIAVCALLCFSHCGSPNTIEYKFIPVATLYDVNDSVISVSKGYRCNCGYYECNIVKDEKGKDYWTYGADGEGISESGRCETHLIKNPKYKE
jgi:hypothetical protein